MKTKNKTITVFEADELSQLQEALEDTYDTTRENLVDWGTNAELEAYDNFMDIIKNATEIKIIKEEIKEE